MDRLPKYVTVKMEKPVEIIDEDSTDSLLVEYLPSFLNTHQNDYTSNQSEYSDITEEEIEIELEKIKKELETIVISDSEDENTESISPENHIQTELSSELPQTNKDLNCPVCDKKFSNEYNVKRHVQIHFRSQNKRPKRTRKPKQSKVNKNDFFCPTCGRSFKRKGHMLRHQSVHAKKVPPKIEEISCPWCNKQFTKKSSLRRHILIHTKNVKCYLCQQHRSQQQRIICPICKRIIGTKSFKWHMRLHSDERPFKCDLCDYSAKRKDYCVRHFKICHTNIENSKKH